MGVMKSPAHLPKVYRWTAIVRSAFEGEACIAGGRTFIKLHYPAPTRHTWLAEAGLICPTPGTQGSHAS